MYNEGCTGWTLPQVLCRFIDDFRDDISVINQGKKPCLSPRMTITFFKQKEKVLSLILSTPYVWEAFFAVVMPERYVEFKNLLQQAQVESFISGCLGQGLSFIKILIHCNLHVQYCSVCIARAREMNFKKCQQKLLDLKLTVPFYLIN